MYRSIAAIAAAAVGVAVVASPASSPPDTGITQDAELVAALGSVAIVDFSDVHLIIVDDAATACDLADAKGCYAPDTRTILVGADEDGWYTTVVAHEFLHHVWARDHLADDEALVAALAALDTPGSLLHRVIDDSYRDAYGDAPATERFAYACTDLKPAQQGTAVAGVCARYLDVAALPVSQSFTSDDIVAGINARRTAADLAPMTVNAGGQRAAQARLDTFTSTDQSSIGTWPDTVTIHLGTCNPVDQAILLTDYRGIDIAVDALDDVINGALTSPDHTTVGVAVREFEVIEGEIDPSDVADNVNMTVIVAMACP